MAPIKEEILSAVQTQLEQHDMLTSDAGWLLAVSGGPDSMALLHAMILLQRENKLNASVLHIAHLNHQLRGTDSVADAEFVRQAGRALHLEVTVESADITGLTG